MKCSAADEIWQQNYAGDLDLLQVANKGCDQVYHYQSDILPAFYATLLITSSCFD
jgi:hypothetical protein